jgi:hypothetical protein
VTAFYGDVTQHRYSAAAGLWSANMQQNYPPGTNIWGRFDATSAIQVQIGTVTQNGNSASVGVHLTEIKNDGTTHTYSGTWYLVRSGSGWLLNSVALTGS